MLDAGTGALRTMNKEALVAQATKAIPEVAVVELQRLDHADAYWYSGEAS